MFGPTPERNYNLKVNKKQKHLAFLSALSLLALEKRVGLFDSHSVLKEAKISTKTVVSFLKANNFLPKKGWLLIVSKSQELFLSTKNVPNVKVVKPLSLTVSLLQAAAFLLCDRLALQELVEARKNVKAARGGRV